MLTLCYVDTALKSKRHEEELLLRAEGGHCAMGGGLSRGAGVQRGLQAARGELCVCVGGGGCHSSMYKEPR